MPPKGSLGFFLDPFIEKLANIYSIRVGSPYTFEKKPPNQQEVKQLQLLTAWLLICKL